MEHDSGKSNKPKSGIKVITTQYKNETQRVMEPLNNLYLTWFVSANVRVLACACVRACVREFTH